MGAKQVRRSLRRFISFRGGGAGYMIGAIREAVLRPPSTPFPAGRARDRCEPELRPTPLLSLSPSPRVKPPRIGVNRRDLLRLRRLQAGFAAGHEPESGSGSPRDLVRVHRPAMGSCFEVRLPAGTPGAV